MDIKKVLSKVQSAPKLGNQAGGSLLRKSFITPLEATKSRQGKKIA